MSPALLTYKEKIKKISTMIIEAQRPIRVLDSVKLPAHVTQQFKKSHYKEMPKLNEDDYQLASLGYDLDAKKEELQEIEQTIQRLLGGTDELGKLLSTIVQEYIHVLELLRARGTKDFWRHSKELYGSPKDTVFDGENSISQLGQMLYQIFSRYASVSLGEESPEDIPSEKAVEILNKRLGNYFGKENGVHAKLSDGIVADAAAGGETVKIRSEAMFSMREINLLEVHEGWVHIGTTMNGSAQHSATWLSKGPPRVASTQEGLAVIMEIFTFRSFPSRAKRINDRLIAIEKVEDGANFIELFDFYRTEGYSDQDSLNHTVRVFRGAPLEGGAPFTKDISYCRGFIENYNFMRAAIRAGRPQLLPFLFVGKISLEDVPLLYQKYLEGIIDAPQFLPPQFKDLHGLVVWMSFSNFLNVVNLEAVHRHYDRLFNLHL